MSTEALAVRAVQSTLDKCDYLTHDIKENDKSVRARIKNGEAKLKEIL